MALTSIRNRLGEAKRQATRRVDIASLVFFRVAFGTMMMWEVWRYLRNGWVERYYIIPDFHFTYFGFSWVTPLEGDGMYVVFYAMGMCALCVAVGFLFRLAAFALWLLISYVFLLEAAFYLNHFYLLCWVSFLLALTPAHRAFSIDARLRPELRSDGIAFWPVLAVRTQMGLVYFFGGVAKITGDWMRGYPLRMWLADRTDFPIIGGLFDTYPMALFMSWGGLLLDLFIVPLLLWRRTRWPALAFALGFHMMNASLFHIGIFPLLATACTLMFLPPDWPRRLFNFPRMGVNLAVDPGSLRTRAVLVALSGFLVIQIALPLRHWLYPGSPHWTEEGHRFAWHMKLRSKDAYADFWAVDTGTEVRFEVDPGEFLSPRQERKMSERPDLILQFAHHVADRLSVDGARPRVYADVRCSLNGRDYVPLIDPTVDLAAEARSLAPAGWILPLDATLEVW